MTWFQYPFIRVNSKVHNNSADEEPNVFESTTTIKLQKLQFQNIEFLFGLLELCWIEQNTTKDFIYALHLALKTLHV